MEEFAYKGYHIRITPRRVVREGMERDGFWVDIFDREDSNIPMERFSVGVGVEILENSLDEVVQLVEDYIGMEMHEKKSGTV